LKILISTCAKYRDETIPGLVDQLKKAGVPEDRIVVISGGEKDDTIQGNVKYQFWELTGLIWLASQNDTGEYYLLIHDTCDITPPFWEELNSKFSKMDTECMRLLENNGGSDMNMGIYKHSYILSRKGELDELKNFDDSEEALKESKLKGYGVEGKFLKNFPLMYSKDEVKITYDGPFCINEIPALGFRKDQANCGRGDLVIKL